MTPIGNDEKNKLRSLIVKHEGLRLKPYLDTVGKLTIGVGRNLNDLGISYNEAMLMLANDLERIQKEAIDNFEWFKNLDVVRQDVILSMIFNMGITRFKKFENLIKSLINQKYEQAACEMSDSRWAGQVGIRADELSEMMRKGIYPIS